MENKILMNMKKSLVRYKKLLISAGISLLLLIVFYYLFTIMVINAPQEVAHYLQTGEMNSEVLPIAGLSVAIIITTLILIVSVLIITIKFIFPNTKAFSSLLMKEEAKQLYDLPKNLKREVFKNE